MTISYKVKMGREVRCQGVILKNRHILVLKQYNNRRNEEYWLLPGGGLESYETEEECVKREIKEETNLDVEIIQLLFDEVGTGIDEYKRYITFLCTPLQNSIEEIGNETENYRKIIDLIWCSLDDENSWNEHIKKAQFFPPMKRIKEKLYF